MNDTSIIVVNGKTFKLKFGLKVSRMLSEKWGFATFNEVLQKLAKAFPDGDQINFDGIYSIFDLILSCVEANVENTDTLTLDELEDMFTENLSELLQAIKIVFSGYMASMPKVNADDAKKPKAPTKKGASL